ncbi:hypothetical protein CLAIMM_11447 [Cladophialophora immunda]|nr:hypothetical protein CLAIMM_11447 [Cladophialophora immunda]
MEPTATSNDADNKNTRGRRAPRTVEEEEAGQTLYKFWARAWEEHDAALALQQMRTRARVDGTHLRYRNYVPTAEPQLPRGTSDDTESDTEDSTAPYSGLNNRSSTDGLSSRTSSNTSTEKSVQVKGDTQAHNTKVNIGRGSRGNESVPLSKANKMRVAADSNASAATITDISRLARMPFSGPGLGMSLRPSNGMKSARIRSILKG